MQGGEIEKLGCHTIFFDESGDTRIPRPGEGAKFFNLTVTCFENDYYRSTVVPGVSTVKQGAFGPNSPVLHYRDMVERINDFSITGKPGRPARVTAAQLNSFWPAFVTFLQQTDFVIFSATVGLQNLRLVKTPKDPYAIALEHVFDGILDWAVHNPGGIETLDCVFESRNDNLNLRAQSAFFDVVAHGTALCRSDAIREKVRTCVFRPKSASDAGLEITDQLANPLSRVAQGKPEHNVNLAPYFPAIQAKLYLGEAQSHDFFGLKRVLF